MAGKDYKIGNCPGCGNFVSEFAIVLVRPPIYLTSIYYPDIKTGFVETQHRLELSPCGCVVKEWGVDQNGLFIGHSAPQSREVILHYDI